jgi:hypothetical protein
MSALAKRLAVLLVASIVALLPPGAQGADAVRIGKAVTSSFPFSGLELGKEQGIWASEGIDLRIYAFRGDGQLLIRTCARSPCTFIPHPTIRSVLRARAKAASFRSAGRCPMRWPPRLVPSGSSCETCRSRRRGSGTSSTARGAGGDTKLSDSSAGRRRLALPHGRAVRAGRSLTHDVALISLNRSY